MYNVVNVEVPFLKECIKGQIPVTVFVVNGFQFKGFIKNFDANVVLVETGGKQQMLYKHAISTIVPMKKVDIELKEQEGT